MNVSPETLKALGASAGQLLVAVETGKTERHKLWIQFAMRTVERVVWVLAILFTPEAATLLEQLPK